MLNGSLYCLNNFNNTLNKMLNYLFLTLDISHIFNAIIKTIIFYRTNNAGLINPLKIS